MSSRRSLAQVVQNMLFMSPDPAEKKRFVITYCQNESRDYMSIATGKGVSVTNNGHLYVNPTGVNMNLAVVRVQLEVPQVKLANVHVNSQLRS